MQAACEWKWSCSCPALQALLRQRLSVRAVARSAKAWIRLGRSCIFVGASVLHFFRGRPAIWAPADACGSPKSHVVEPRGCRSNHFQHTSRSQHLVVPAFHCGHIPKRGACCPPAACLSGIPMVGRCLARLRSVFCVATFHLDALACSEGGGRGRPAGWRRPWQRLRRAGRALPVVCHECARHPGPPSCSRPM